MHDSEIVLEYHLHDVLLYMLDKLCVPKVELLQLIREAHTYKLTENFGVGMIVANLQRYVCWPKIQEHLTRFITWCMLCYTRNPSTRKHGLHHPLPIYTHLWERISMEFVRGLPTSRKGYEYLFVVVERFSKICIMMPCIKTICGQEETNLFFGQVWAHFGIPMSIVSKRDMKFLSLFWIILRIRWTWSWRGLQRTNEQMEVVNMTLVQLLRGYNQKYLKN